MFRIKNTRGSTVAKNSNFLPSLQSNKPIPPRIKQQQSKKQESLPQQKKNANRKTPVRNFDHKKIQNTPIIRPPSRKAPARVRTPYKKSQLANVNIQAHKKHNHKLGFHAKDIEPPKIDAEMIQRKMKRQWIQQNNSLTIEKNTQSIKPLNGKTETLQDPIKAQQIIFNKKDEEEHEALQFLLKKQEQQKERKAIQQRQKEKIAEEERRKEAQRQRRVRQRQLEAKEQQEREKQALQQIEKIKKRRQQREREKSRRKQLQQQREKNRQQLMNGQISGGMMFTNDNLAHFEISDVLMDAQIHKIIKTSFAHFPSGTSIQAKKGELERINMSYQMICDDPDNQRMAAGLKNYRIQLLNQIGQLIMEDQRNGFSHPDFSIIEGDSRSGQVCKDVSLTRGIPKGKTLYFTQKVICKDSQDCPICLQMMGKGQEGSKLKCGHIFHQNCAEDWLQLNANCPSCRRNIKFDI